MPKQALGGMFLYRYFWDWLEDKPTEFVRADNLPVTYDHYQ